MRGFESPLLRHDAAKPVLCGIVFLYFSCLNNGAILWLDFLSQLPHRSLPAGQLFCYFRAALSIAATSCRVAKPWGLVPSVKPRSTA